ncbi:DUF3263 domain-containing protein [Micromonospora sp. DSM 115977]|uniref:DUF3263 domain-containing protein n=1 Tax=Micromonospora reichwaldensis TaxID=3075516 RepID=A0ABU2WUS4_9ACTN|nr:DUF3263 domain-containing protein [Micromonospora sp. DSM 115977]MDT0529611.1 DUF3263 domain-containing protein [Micromonospora sp. DSM 115977]
MQPADAAPAATEPPVPGRPGEAGATVGADPTGEARDTASVVPQPRTVPGAATPAVPQPRSAPEPDAAVAAPREAGAPADAGPEGGLTERERGILAFEQQWWRHAGAKEQAIRDTFGLSATRYYQLLNGLLDNPAALAAEPVLVGRLRRLRSSRARNRRR